MLGELESFRNDKGFRFILPKILDAIQLITKVRIFLMSLSITFLSLKVLGFLFPQKNGLTKVVECEKLNFRRS